MMRDRGRSLLDRSATIEKWKARIFAYIFKSPSCRLLFLMLWMVNVRPKMDVILLSKFNRSLVRLGLDFQRYK